MSLYKFKKTNVSGKRMQIKWNFFWSPYVAGNDMSRVYAPLTRSGRMDLWMWEPNREELVAMVWLWIFPPQAATVAFWVYPYLVSRRAL